MRCNHNALHSTPTSSWSAVLSQIIRYVCRLLSKYSRTRTAAWTECHRLRLLCIMHPAIRLLASFDIPLLPNPTYIAIQMTLMTTSRPLLSPPSYLKLHIPSVFSFQYAPVALCIPLRPTWGFPSVPVAVLASVSVEDIEESWEGLGLLRAEVGTRCCMMVLLTAYLKDGVPPAGEDSEIKERRIEFCEGCTCQQGMNSEAGAKMDVR